jgi:hypothetical protein
LYHAGRQHNLGERQMSKFKWFGPVVAVVLLALAMGGPTLSAKGKPGGGGGGGGGGETPAGVVYFYLAGQMHTMNADGGAKAALPANVAGEPSQTLHGGHRWFLDVRFVVGVYPDGTDRRELFAVRDDGNEVFTVQLTDDPQLKLLKGTVNHKSRWSVDAGDFANPDDDVTDGLASWRAVRFSVSGEPDASSSGIYAMPVLFDGGGDVDPLSMLAIPELVVPSGVIDDQWFGAMPDIHSHDWSPDGTFIVYNQFNSSTNSLAIADAETGFSMFLTGEGVDPQWSPDGATIAFRSSAGIETIRPDGTNRTVIVQDQSSRRKTHNAKTPTWSPDSQHVAYHRQVFQTSGWSNSTGDVYRATNTGASKTNLTNDTDDFAHPVAWRE